MSVQLPVKYAQGIQSRAGGLPFFFEAKALPTNIDDGAAMEQPVQCGRSHDGVAGKDFGPVAESFVRGEDDGAVVIIALRDHLKEETGLGLI